jgi:hypothetical protein
MRDAESGWGWGDVWVTWVTLSLSVIRNQHGNEEGPFTHYAAQLRGDG